MKVYKLEDIDKCHVCGSADLMPMHGIEIEDLISGEIMRKETVFCTECETLHYIAYGVVNYEFSLKIGQLPSHKRVDERLMK